MPIIFKLDFKNLKKNVLKDISRTVSKVTNMVYQDIIELSPIDTGEYLSNHKNMGIRIEKTRVIGTIENVGEYTERVEKGFRKTPVNWHLLNIGQIYYSRGANVYEKAIAKNKDFFIKSLR